MFLFLCFLSVVHSKFIFDAVRADDPEEIAESLKNGADINMIGNGGQTPLMNAVLSGKLESVEYLLSQGADTSIGEKDGYTPMHGAGFQGRAEIARVLINHGLDPRDKHQDGYEPIHRACWGREDRHMETANVLIETVRNDPVAKDHSWKCDAQRRTIQISVHEVHAYNKQFLHFVC